MKGNYLLTIFLLLFLAISPGYSDGKGNVSGYIYDRETGEPVPYANVILKTSNYGAATDVHGRYSIINVEPGNYTLFVSMIGYKKIEKEIKIKSGDDLRTDMELDREAIQTQSVEVTAEANRFKNKVDISRTNLSIQQIQKTPAFIEEDVFRTLQMTPSVQSKNDFSSALVVRGGSPDENLILLDGIEIYNPYHLGGLFSSFNAKALSDAEFLAGGFPAEYGNRNSSVVSITSREGNSRRKLFFKDSKFGEHFNVSQIHGEVSLLTSKALLEGPVGNGSWMVAARRTYFDKIAGLYYTFQDEDMPGKYYFWDTQSKIIQNITDKDRITLTGYYGRDFLEMDFQDDESNDGFKLDFDWGNYTNGIQWRHVPNSRINSTTALYHTNYDWDVTLKFTQEDSVEGQESFTNDVSIMEEVSLRDFTFKQKVDYAYSENHLFSAGLEYKRMKMKTFQKVEDITFLNRNKHVGIFGAYLQDKWQVTPLLTLQPGIRISRYNNHSKTYIDPRISLKYMLSENSALKASWGIFNQFIFTESNDEEILNFVNVWAMVPEDFDAQSCQHFIAGYEKHFNNGIFASIEGYYKPYSNLLTINPKNDPSIQSDDFIEGTGRAYGLELLVKKSMGKFTGWIGYTWNGLERKVDFNGDGRVREKDGEIYNPKYDMPHSLNMVFSYKLNKKNSFGLTVKSNSGQPYTPVVGKTYTQSGMGDFMNPYDNLRTISGKRNSARYPIYFRSDISYVRDIDLFGADGKFKFQIINFTNHFNTLFYYWQHDKSPSQVEAFSMFPVTPSVGIEFKI